MIALAAALPQAGRQRRPIASCCASVVACCVVPACWLGARTVASRCTVRRCLSSAAISRPGATCCSSLLAVAPAPGSAAP